MAECFFLTTTRILYAGAHMYYGVFVLHDEQDIERHYRSALTALAKQGDSVPEISDKWVRMFVILVAIVFERGSVLKYAESEDPQTLLPREVACTVFRRWAADMETHVKHLIYLTYDADDPWRAGVVGTRDGHECVYRSFCEFFSAMCSSSGLVPKMHLSNEYYQEVCALVSFAAFKYASCVVPFFVDPLITQQGDHGIVANGRICREMLQHKAEVLAGDRQITAHDLAAEILVEHREYIQSLLM